MTLWLRGCSSLGLLHPASDVRASQGKGLCGIGRSSAWRVRRHHARTSSLSAQTPAAVSRIFEGDRRVLQLLQNAAHRRMPLGPRLSSGLRNITDIHPARPSSAKGSQRKEGAMPDLLVLCSRFAHGCPFLAVASLRAPVQGFVRATAHCYLGLALFLHPAAQYSAKMLGQPPSVKQEHLTSAFSFTSALPIFRNL